MRGVNPILGTGLGVSGLGRFAALAACDGAHHERADDAQGIGGRLRDDDDAEADASLSRS